MKYEPKGPPRYAHQRLGLAKLIQSRGVAALLFDPGTGKTATTLDYCSLLALKMTGGEARVLVVAPLAAIDTWVSQPEDYVTDQVSVWAEALGGSIRQKAEALAARGGSPFRDMKRRKKDGPRAAHAHRSLAIYSRGPDGKPTPIEQGPDGLGRTKPRLVITSVNLDAFSSRQRHKSGTMADLMLEAVKRYDPHLVVIDESHKIKSATSNVSRLMARISEHVPRRIILTGTVMPKGPLDVFGQWRFLDPHAFGQMQADGTRRRATFDGFKNRYAVMGGFMGREVVGYHSLDDLQRIMRLRAAVARKEDALDLPPTTSITVPVHLTPKEQQAYDDMKENLATLLGGQQTVVTNRLAQMMRLRQITSGHLPDDSGVLHEVGTSKVDTITSIVQDTLAGEKRIVIFSMFKPEIAALSRRLAADRSTEVMTITGDTPNDERIAMRRRFGSDDPARIVLVAQIKTLSLAVNELVTASHAIFGSLSQQRDDLIQAQDRLNRIGQTRPVTFWFAQAPGTVDDVIMETHRNGTNLEAAMLKHIMEGSSPFAAPV